ncbi:MAG: AAA family ATPase [Candidatus Omnitrophota bacterium]
MSYYMLLGLEKEPFSNSPDPAFLYLSREHDMALTTILIELRLKRGLSVILGDIGTGKTTLSRKIVQELHMREDFIFHVILNPTFENEKEFLYSLIKNFQVPFDADYGNASVSEMRDAFEKYLLRRNMEERKTVVLIIDEAQKLNNETLESLRILLNYETNEYKLIQLVLLGQLEFYSKILQIPNFADRIDFKFTLNPLSSGETREMIEFRVRQAGYKAPRYLFQDDAVNDIYYFTKGYPRGIIRVCHKCLRALVMDRKKVAVDKELTNRILEKESNTRWQKITIPQNESF